MIKNNLLFIVLILSMYTFGQTEIQKERFKRLKPDLWLGIWDKENSDVRFKVDTLSYDDLPKYIEFRGTVVEALKWTDKAGEKILIQSVTGQFRWKDYEKGTKEYTIQDKSELYVYLFEKKNNEPKYIQSWKIYDYLECYGVDWFTGFVPKATTITDINNNGISEITIPYVLICRGGMDPGIMKIILYENGIKYAVRGSTKLACESEYPYGGENTPDDSLKNNELFLRFLQKRWDQHVCEKDRFY